MAEGGAHPTNSPTADPTADPTGPEPTQQEDRQAMPVDHEQPPKLGFAVVGIGASAGGLEAFTDFITSMRPDSGMAFVFIQHLPPERESMMAEILSRKTAMLVQQVEDGMEVMADHLYVIRPGHVLTIRDGRFHLGPQLGKRAANRPVDDFFKSLAEEQRERAIGVILSGMGSNGSAGAQAIKAVGGMCIAQDPETAQYASMPRHLIDQGYADYILSPADMPEVLLQYAGHPYARENRRDAVEQAKRYDNHVREIIAILRTRTRTDFNGYKKPTVVRRIQRRMGLTRLTEMGDYAKLLRQSPSEVRSLADDLLIHVTGFFRDRESWEAMREKVIAPLVARREAESEVRAWVTACSSGEEAYSLAMLLVEEADRQNKPVGIKVFATDMAERPLHHARAGIYPGGIESEIDPERLERFFEKDDGLYRIRQRLRECVVFAPQNVLSDPPFSRLDIVSCRNLLIYLEPDVQHRVLNLLHFGLREGGTLFLGSSETVGGAEELYEVVDKRARIFRRVGPTRHGQLDFPLPMAVRGAGGGGGDDAGGLASDAAEMVRSAERRPGAGRPSIALITQRTLLLQHVKAAVTVDRDHRILYFHGNTRAYMDQPSGEPTRDIMMLVHEGLRGSIRVALHRCAAEMRAVTVVDGWLEMSPGRRVRVAVTASPVAAEDPSHPDYFVVSFEELEEARGEGAGEGNGDGGNGDTALADDELRGIRDELQTTVEELQTSNEELKASHEEVTSINEELQSANEELETSKEEMQSLNEELTTVNAQLTAKMEEHQNASNDLTALLASTSIAVLFLDTSYRIRRYTPALRELMDLIPGDVGRPLSDLRRKFEDPELDRDVRAVLEKLVPVEREVPAQNGRHYARRALPYRTMDNRIDGVVVTFVDVTERKLAEQEAERAREYAESIVETLHEPLLVLNADLTIRSANPAFYQHFKVAEAETRGRRIYDLGNGQWDIPALRTALEEVLPTNKMFDAYEVVHDFEGLGRRRMLINGRRLDNVQLILIGIRDITAAHDIESQLRQSESQFRTLVQNLHDYAILMLDPKGVITQWTEGAQRVTGYTEKEALGRHVSMIYTPEQAASGYVEQELGEAAKTGRAEREDWRTRKGGERFWCNEIVTAIKDAEGELCGFAKISRDLGERRWIEAALRESEERYKLIVEHVKDYGIFTLDPHGKVTSWNPGAARIFLYEADEIIGQNGRILFTPEDVATGESEQELKTAAQQGRASDDRWQMRKGGERFWAAGVTTALRDETGNQLLGFVKILRDETARRRTDESRAQAAEAAEVANRVKDEFLATLAHELRTPLSAILLWSGMLRNRTLAPEQFTEGLHAIADSAEAQKKLIDDLLDTSRIAAGKLWLQLGEVELAPAVRAAVDAILPTADAKGVAVHTDFGKDVGVVTADPDRLRQVIWNLLTNAVKFTPAGGRVDVALARHAKDGVEIRVADTGRGIEPELLPHVFDPFRQGDSPITRTHGGLGLGLAITRQLVELHGGTIRAESAGADKGAMFVVRLPLPRLRRGGGAGAAGKPAAGGGVAAAAAATGKRAARRGLEGVRVLLIEDDAGTRKAIAMLLRAAGAALTAVADAASAFEAFRESPPDVIVSDIGLPGEDGNALMRRIRAHESAGATGPEQRGAPSPPPRRVPAIALTAFARDDDRRRSLDAGFDQHVAKPVNPEQLLAAIESAAVGNG